MRRLVFLGSKAAGLRVCRRLVSELPDRALAAIICPDDAQDARSVTGEFESAARAGGVEFHIAPNRAATVELLRRLAPQTVIVHGWYQIIPTAELSQIKFLGFHYSPLPQYRGNAPLVWQIINGEKEVGVSLFELVPEMDAGRLYAQARAPIGPDDTIAEALEKANGLADDMLGNFIRDWVADAVLLRDQPATEPSYCALRVADDGHIDWRSSAQAIHDFVRAQARPYPGAFSYLPDGQRVTIWRTELEPRRFMGVPGGVGEIGSNHVVITTGDGAVRLLEVQLGDAPAAPAPSVIRSLKTRLGDNR